MEDKIRKYYSCGIDGKFNDYALCELSMMVIIEEPSLKNQKAKKPFSPEKLENVVFRYQFLGKSWAEIRKAFFNHLNICESCNAIYKEYYETVKQDAKNVLDYIDAQQESIVNMAKEILDL